MDQRLSLQKPHPGTNQHIRSFLTASYDDPPRSQFASIQRGNFSFLHISPIQRLLF